MAKRGKKRISQTASGRRAVRGSKTGVRPFGDSSIQTGTHSTDGRTLLVPHIVGDERKGFTQFGKGAGATAVARALRTGDYVQVRSPEEGTKRSKRFSATLTRHSKRAQRGLTQVDIDRERG